MGKSQSRKIIYEDHNKGPFTDEDSESEEKGPEEIHRDQLKRESIPVRADLKTMYHPCGSLIMVIPLPDTVRVGRIIIPEKARDHMIEGHIVEFGPDVPIAMGAFALGDCVTWAQHNEYQMELDGNVRFVLIPYTSIIMRIPQEELRTAAALRPPTDAAGTPN